MQPGSWRDLLAPVLPPDDVEAAVAELGIEVERSEDGELWARCPQHLARTGKVDRHASFSVHDEKGVFNCFSCGYQGGFADLVGDVLGITHSAAATWVQERGGLASAVRRLTRTAASVQPVVNRARSAPEAEYFAFEDPPEKELAKRKISADAAARFGIKWDHGWVLPIRHARTHELLGWQTKHSKIVRNYPEGIKKSQTLFGLNAAQGDRVYLVESPLDCARLWTAGVDGGVSSFGAMVSDAQIEALVRAADTVVVALDNDEAGWTGAEQVERRLTGRVRILRWSYPEDLVGKDPGDMSDEQIYHSATNAHSPLWHRFAGAR